MSVIYRTKEHKRISREVVDEATLISRHRRENALIGAASAAVLGIFIVALSAGDNDAPLQRQVDAVNECADVSMQAMVDSGYEARPSDINVAINNCEALTGVQLSEVQFDASQAALAAMYGVALEG